MKSDEDYVYVEFNGKTSDNYQSAGATVGYGSPRQKNESVDDHFSRVQAQAFEGFVNSMLIVGEINETK